MSLYQQDKKTKQEALDLLKKCWWWLQYIPWVFTLRIIARQIL